MRDESAAPGRLNSALSWTHYRLLTKVESPDARSFYEIEAAANRWSSRELERQINSLLFERLARSRDKKGMIRLARRGHEIQTASDVIKDPLVLEFLGIPSNHRMQESDLETALIDHLQYFLLELILCTDKNDAVVKYTLGRANRQIFASRYKLYLPSERELAREIRRELSEVRGKR